MKWIRTDWDDWLNVDLVTRFSVQEVTTKTCSSYRIFAYTSAGIGNCVYVKEFLTEEAALEYLERLTRRNEEK